MEMVQNRVTENLNEIFSWPKDRIAREVHPDFNRYFSYQLELGNIHAYYREISSYVAESGFRGHVLDFGCGFGLVSMCMRSLGVDIVTGADIVPDKFNTARKLAAMAGCDKVDFVRSDDNLAFKDASFDGVLIKDALSHLNEDSPFLAHAYRVLRPGGVLFIVDDRNSLSPLNVRSTRKMWEVSESGTPEETKKIGIARNYTDQRLDFLQTQFPDMDRKHLKEIAIKYRGYNNQQLETWLKGGTLGAKHAPCVGPNGIVQERLMNPFTLKRQLEKIGFECRLRPGYHNKTWKRAIFHAAWPVTLLYSGLFHVIAKKS